MTPGILNLTLYRGATFGPIVITAKDANRNIVDLTNWIPFAQVRKSPSSPKILDLVPTITDPVGGQVTIPIIVETSTVSFPHGNYVWDFLLQRPSGEIIGPLLAGTFVVTSTVTRV